MPKSSTDMEQRGRKQGGSLLAWRISDARSSEPRAHALALVNPHNLCYANSVLRIMHQARSLEGPCKVKSSCQYSQRPGPSCGQAGRGRPGSMMQQNFCSISVNALSAQHFGEDVPVRMRSLTNSSQRDLSKCRRPLSNGIIRRLLTHLRILRSS